MTRPLDVVYEATGASRVSFEVRSLITGRFPVSAHRDLLLGAATGIKNVLRFG